MGTYDNLALALAERLDEIRSHEDFRGAVAVLAEMNALRPPPKPAPDPHAPLWKARHWLSRPSFHSYAVLNIRQDADGLFRCGSDFSCSWGDCLRSGGTGYATPAEALADARSGLLENMRYVSRRLDALRDTDRRTAAAAEMRLMLAEVESAELNPAS